MPSVSEDELYVSLLTHLPVELGEANRDSLVEFLTYYVVGKLLRSSQKDKARKAVMRYLRHYSATFTVRSRQ